MLTREVMGVFALAVLWLNTLLVAGAALARARVLAARRAKLAAIDPGSAGAQGQYGLVKGSLKGGTAELVIEQVGRFAAGKRRAILWHDRSHTSAIRGASVEVGGQAIAIADASGAAAETWLAPEPVLDAFRCPDAATFDEIYPGARKAKGAVRPVRVEVKPGGEVWVAGRLGGSAEQPRLEAGGAEEPLVVATIDPRGWLSSKIAMLVLFAPATLLGAAACTAVAIWPPVFDGWISKAGGLLCFVYFLLVLPAGTRAREASVEPPKRPLRGRWDEA